MKIENHPDVWAPTQFAELFAHVLRPSVLKGGRALEIGVGSGVLAVVVGKLGMEVIGTDLNPKAGSLSRRNWVANGLNPSKYLFLHGDLFVADQLSGETFDLIWFNAPTFPSIHREHELMSERDKFEEGGNEGRELVERFVAGVGAYIRPHTEVFTVVTSKQNIPLALKKFQQFCSRCDVVEERDIPLASHYFRYIDYWSDLAKTDGVKRIWKVGDSYFQKVCIIRLSGFANRLG